MGRTYHARNKKAKGNMGSSFDVNFAGADVLGFIMRSVRCHSLVIERLHAPLRKAGIDRPCTKYKMTAKQARVAAGRLRKLTDRQKANLYKRVKGNWDTASTRKEFEDFIMEWVEFLETCSGYEVPG